MNETDLRVRRGREGLETVYGLREVVKEEALCAVDMCKTIDAIPVEWLEERRFATSFHGAEPDIDLNYAFTTVINEWQKEQEAKK